MKASEITCRNQEYVSPQVTGIEINAERGFAGSALMPPLEGDIDLGEDW